MVGPDSVSRRRVIELGGGLVLFGGIAGGIGAADEHDETGDGGADGTTEEGGDTGETTGTARVRAAHLSPDAPNVDVYVEGNSVLEDVPFGAVSDYQEVEPGSYNVQVVPAGGDPANAVIDEDVEVGEGDYTIAAIGEAAGESQPLQALVLEDDNSPLAADTARIRVLHASPDAPAVDVTVAASGDALFENVAFGESGYVEVPQGDYRLCIYPAGERDEAVLGVDVSPAGGTVYSAFAVGYVAPDEAPADEPFDVVLTEDATPDAASGADETG